MECFKLYSDYLTHSRTKGSKNGERRYQYEDGTYTELGKERRRKGGDQFQGLSEQEALDAMQTYTKMHATKKAYKRAVEEENSEHDIQSTIGQVNNIVNQSTNTAASVGRIADRSRNKKAQAEAMLKAKSMSNEELQKAINRINLENNYVRAVAPESHKGENITREVLQTVGSVIAITGGVVGIVKTIKG